MSSPATARARAIESAQLTRSGGFSGVDGAFRLLPDGSIDRPLAVLEVQKFGTGVVDAPPSLASGAPAATSALPPALNFN